MKYIRMQSRTFSLGIIVGFLFAVCQPQASAQFRRGSSFSAAHTNARELEIDLGPIEFNRGITRSGALTANRGGVSKADSVAVSRGVNIAGFDIDSTLKRFNQRRNGQVAHAVGYQLDVGPLGFEVSLNRQNLRKPWDLNLGFLNLYFDLYNQRNNNPDVSTAGSVNARGRNAFTHSGTNANVNTRRVGFFDVTDSSSYSRGIAYARRGQTSANTFGEIDGNTQSHALTRGFYRGRRTTTQNATKSTVSSKLFLNNHVEKPKSDKMDPQERTFSFLGNLFGGFLGGPTPNCVYPCTLEAYQRNACCPPEYLPIPVPLDSQTCQTCLPRSQFGQYYPQTQNSYFSQFPNNYFGNRFYQQTHQCCSICLQYNYYGPAPCSWRSSQFRPNYF